MVRRVKVVLGVLAVLMLLLATAQLALAQQDTTTPSQTSDTPQPQYTSDTPTTGDDQSPADDSGGQSDGQTQPAAGSQSSPSDTGRLMHLNQNNGLVIDCPTVSNDLAQSGSTQTDQEAQLKNLSQLCADSGYKPANSSGGSTQYQ